MKNRDEAAKIRNALFRKRITLASIDRANNLPTATACNALYEPYEAGEVAIAKALGKQPHELWPSRYDKGGVRLSPQPAKNYRKRSTTSQRQKTEAA